MWVSVSPRHKKTGSHDKMDRNQSPGSHPCGLTGALSSFFRAMPWMWWCLLSPAVIMQHLATSHFSSGTKNWDLEGPSEGGARSDGGVDSWNIRNISVGMYNMCNMCSVYYTPCALSSPKVGGWWIRCQGWVRSTFGYHAAWYNWR